MLADICKIAFYLDLYFKVCIYLTSSLKVEINIELI